MKVGVIQTSYEKGIEKPVLQHWTTKELLDDISAHGIRQVKLWIKNHPFDGCGAFPWTTRWGTKIPSSSSDIPTIEDMDRVWRHKGIDTYFIRFLSPMWAGDVFEEEPTFDIAKKFLQRYGHLHKTIVITNWEGDWQWRGTPPNNDGEGLCRARLDFLMAEIDRRQKAVERARAMFPTAALRVFHSTVVNVTEEKDEFFGQNVCRALMDKPFRPDFIGLSHWGRQQPLDQRLQYISSVTDMPPERIYIDEVGEDATDEKQDVKLEAQLAVAQDFGCPYAFVWQWKQTWYEPNQDNVALWMQDPGQGKVKWAGPAPAYQVVQEFNVEEP